MCLCNPPKERFAQIQFTITVPASLQANIDKQARKLEEIRAQPHAPGPQGKAAKQKKIEKLDKTVKMQMAKESGGRAHEADLSGGYTGYQCMHLLS